MSESLSPYVFEGGVQVRTPSDKEKRGFLYWLGNMFEVSVENGSTPTVLQLENKKKTGFGVNIVGDLTVSGSISGTGLGIATGDPGSVYTSDGSSNSWSQTLIWGPNAVANDSTCIALGDRAITTGGSSNAIALGNLTTAGNEAIAIGSTVTANVGSTVIGNASSSTIANTVTIGNLLTNSVADSTLVQSGFHFQPSRIVVPSGFGNRAVAGTVLQCDGSGNLTLEPTAAPIVAASQLNGSINEASYTHPASTTFVVEEAGIFSYDTSGSTDFTMTTDAASTLVSGMSDGYYFDFVAHNVDATLQMTVAGGTGVTLTQPIVMAPGTTAYLRLIRVDASNATLIAINQPIAYDQSPGTNATGFGNGSSASGLVSLAFGRNADASGDLSVAIGNAAVASGADVCAFGYGAQGQADGSVVLGRDAVCNSQGTAGVEDQIVIGHTAIAEDSANRGIVIGANSTIGSGGAGNEAGMLAIGSNITLTGTNTVAIGEGATPATSTYGVGVGVNATLNGNFSVAVGANSTAAQTGVSVGYNSSGTTLCTCIGYGAQSTFSSSTFIGYDAGDTSVSQGVAVGSSTTLATNGVAVGHAADATGISGAVAVGHSSDATGQRAVAVGPTAVASATDSVQIGTGTNATANSLQFGTGSYAWHFQPTFLATPFTTTTGQILTSDASGRFQVSDYPISVSATGVNIGYSHTPSFGTQGINAGYSNTVANSDSTNIVGTTVAVDRFDDSIILGTNISMSNTIGNTKSRLLAIGNNISVPVDSCGDTVALIGNNISLTGTSTVGDNAMILGSKVALNATIAANTLYITPTSTVLESTALSAPNLTGVAAGNVLTSDGSGNLTLTNRRKEATSTTFTSGGVNISVTAAEMHGYYAFDNTGTLSMPNALDIIAEFDLEIGEGFYCTLHNTTGSSKAIGFGTDTAFVGSDGVLNASVFQNVASQATRTYLITRISSTEVGYIPVAGFNNPY